MGKSTGLLVNAVQELSMARGMDAVAAVVRRVARQLVGSDGATFVLRDGNLCYYADEEAIEPLWKGSRFPMEACVSGWVMLNKVPAVIPDIYADPRVPVDAYRPTFVKSMAMVPIRSRDPIGAIGNYWAKPHSLGEGELEQLQALADSTAIAIENVRLYRDLERRVEERTAELATTLAELETFSYSVAHDLRAPLRALNGFGQALMEDYDGVLDGRGKDYLRRIAAGATRMGELIDALLELSRVTRAEVTRHQIDLSALARDVGLQFKNDSPVQVVVAEGLEAEGDPRLLRAALDNLVGNACKFTQRVPEPRVEVGIDAQRDGTPFYVRDNGAGFDMQFAHKLFAPFGRLHAVNEFPGTGIGLATVQRIVHKHGGRIWAEAAVGQGATFFFTLPRRPTLEL